MIPNLLATPRAAIRSLVLMFLLAVSGACAAPGVRHGPAPAAAQSCFTTDPLARADQLLADSLLTEALDNEGLYTLVGSLKPMSSVAALRLRTARPDSSPSGVRATTDSASPDLARMARYQRVASALHCGAIEMLVVPFRATQGGVRNVEIVVVNRALLDRALARDQAFWGQFGFVPGSDPAVVVTATEFGEKLDRFRAYGYLFGYPEHAVTFFVEADRQSNATREFVKREFVAIPVHSRVDGRFTYAVPVGHPLGEADLALRTRAAEVLAEYRRRRPRFVNPDGSLRALELLREWYAEAGRP